MNLCRFLRASQIQLTHVVGRIFILDNRRGGLDRHHSIQRVREQHQGGFCQHPTRRNGVVPSVRCFVSVLKKMSTLFRRFPIRQKIMERLFQRFRRNGAETTVVHFQKNAIRDRVVNFWFRNTITRIQRRQRTHHLLCFW